MVWRRSASRWLLPLFRCIHIVTILGFLLLFWFRIIQVWQQKLPHELVGAFKKKKALISFCISFITRCGLVLLKISFNFKTNKKRKSVYIFFYTYPVHPCIVSSLLQNLSLVESLKTGFIMELFFFLCRTFKRTNISFFNRFYFRRNDVIKLL